MNGSKYKTEWSLRDKMAKQLTLDQTDIIANGSDSYILPCYPIALIQENNFFHTL